MLPSWLLEIHLGEQSIVLFYCYYSASEIRKIFFREVIKRESRFPAFMCVSELHVHETGQLIFYYPNFSIFQSEGLIKLNSKPITCTVKVLFFSWAKVWNTWLSLELVSFLLNNLVFLWRFYFIFVSNVCKMYILYLYFHIFSYIFIGPLLTQTLCYERTS